MSEGTAAVDVARDIRALELKVDLLQRQVEDLTGSFTQVLDILARNASRLAALTAKKAPGTEA